MESSMRPADGWSIGNIQVITDQDAMILIGDLVNNTGSAQQVVSIVGTFYNDRGEVIAGPDDTDDFWLVKVVPPQGRVPVELTVYDIQSAAKFNLRVFSQPSSETPRQDFEIVAFETSQGRGRFCATGRLRNPGDRLLDYLLIGMVLYNDEGKVINFDGYNASFPGNVVGEETLDFDICIDTYDQEVAGYEFGVWGR